MIPRRPSSAGISLLSVKLADAVRSKIEEQLRDKFGEAGGVIDVTVNAYATKRRIAVMVEVVARSSEESAPEPGALRFKL